MAKKLTNLRITNVSLVDEGACSAAHITLFKAKEGGNATMTNEQVEVSTEEVAQETTNEEVEKVEDEATNEEVEVAQETTNEEVEKVEDETEQLKEKVATLEKQLEEVEKSKEENEQLKEKVATLEKQLEEVEKSKEKETTEEEILKNVDPVVVEMLQKAKKEADVHRQAILKMKEEQENAELTNVAKSLVGVGTGESEMVSLLRKAKHTDLELYNEVVKAFEVASNIIADSMVMKSIGCETGASDSEGDAWAKVDAKAEEIAKDRNITKQKATGIVMSEFPELYQAYLNELK